MVFYGHSTDYAKETWQPLKDHLFNVSSLAGTFAHRFSAEDWGLWCGLLHDIGKFSQAFQRYLENNRGRVDHSTAGSQLADKVIGEKLGRFIASFAGFVVAGHHAGLPNGGRTLADAGSLVERLQRELPDYGNWPKEIELPPLPALPPAIREAHAEERGFAISFFIRMLFSCLTDADYLDTEKFCDPTRAEQRFDSIKPASLLPRFDAFMAKLAEKPAKNQTIARWRQEILDHCRTAGQRMERGTFSLTVPTGGGKTLSSLAFALDHAKRHNLERIIYVIPFTSIIEQNAEVFRQAVGEEAVLEHHSAYVFPQEKDDIAADEKASAEEAVAMRLAAENWNATLIVTTAVQFFESLFACRSSRCRKLHNIANSVVILDEAQMLPPELLNPSVMALRELARGYGVSAVLCTATQPALEKTHHLSAGFRDGEIREIIPQERLAPMFEAFRRVDIRHEDVLDNATLAVRLRECEQVLCIVNTRGHARELFEALGGEEEGHFHLSALMYPAHRQKTLKTIRERLSQGKRCRVISTSLIEAGVDVDFPVVYRALTGLDSIAQAAGRANREGKAEGLGQVIVFTPEGKYLPKAPYFGRRAACGEWVRERHADLLSAEAIKAYFSQLYSLEILDGKGILPALENGIKQCKPNDIPNIPFRDVSSAYQFIEDNMEPVIIECEAALSMVETLERSFDPSEIRTTLRQLQLYTVPLYRYQMDQLSTAGNVRRVKDRFAVLSGGSNYSERMGLVLDDPTYRERERNIF